MIVGTSTSNIFQAKEDLLVIFVGAGHGKQNRLLQLLEEYIPGISQVEFKIGVEHCLPARMMANRKLIIIAAIHEYKESDWELAPQRIIDVFNQIDSHLTISSIIPGVRANGQNDPDGQEKLVETFEQLRHKITIYYDAANPPASLTYIQELMAVR